MQYRFLRNLRVIAVRCALKLTESTTCLERFLASTSFIARASTRKCIIITFQCIFMAHVTDFFFILLRWLLEHHTCPLCKARVLKQYGYVVSEDGPTDV